MDQVHNEKNKRAVFTEEMKKTHTILVPMMLPVHFELLKTVLELEGYKVDLLKSHSSHIADIGLRYTHNDTCYPAQLTIGQLMDAIESGNYDENKIALMLMQTGGGCRASNYVSLLRKALKNAGKSHIPVVSFNMAGLEENPGFKITIPIIKKMAIAILYGDLIMHLRNQIKPYEINKGEANRVLWQEVYRLANIFSAKNGPREKDMKKESKKILKSFSKIKRQKKAKTKVGVVGEIYVKFAPLGNNNLEEFLENEDAEVVMPGLMDFVLYTIDAGVEDFYLYGDGKIKKIFSQILLHRILRKQNMIISLFKKFPQFTAPIPFKVTKNFAKQVIHTGTKMGEGWLLTGEMVCLINNGVTNIVCTQPFGCLPNHIVGRGMIRKIKELYPEANIVPVDYDASASKINQENRIKLMLQSAKTSL